MKVIVPIQFQSSQLVSTNATDSTAAYNPATSYSKGAEVDYGNYIYESLVNSNTGKQPDISPNEWLRVRPDNIYAMFDNAVSTKTIRSSPLTVSIKPGAATNSLALLGLKATSVEIKVRSSPGGSVVYNKVINLSFTPVVDWYSYFFSEFDYLDTLTLMDIPPYSNAVIEITITDTRGDVELGSLIFGNFTDIGKLQYGLGFGIRDYSIKETDIYGNVTFVQRAFSRRMEPSVLIENSRLRYISKVLNDIRATPTVWIGSEDATYEPLTMFGYYRDYNIDIAYPANSLLRLEIESLI